MRKPTNGSPRLCERHAGSLIGFAAHSPPREAGRLRQMLTEEVKSMGLRAVRSDGHPTRELLDAALELNIPVLYYPSGRWQELCAVVKANAYGHGDVWCAKAALAGGAGWLAVATAGEAAELRRHGIASRILMMGALTHEEARAGDRGGGGRGHLGPDFARAARANSTRAALPGCACT